LVGTTIEVLGGWHNVEQPTDINDDSYTTSLDSLIVINELNAGGSRHLEDFRQLVADASDEFPAHIDVNGDGNLTPSDAMAIIYELNSAEHSLTLQEPLLRPLVSWVDWQSLESEMTKAEWSPLAGIGLPMPEMLDLSHEVFSELEVGEVLTDSPSDWVPMGVEQVRNALPSEAPALHAQASVDRIFAAASRLEENIDALDLHAILPGIAANVDLELAQRVFRDRFFAEISKSEFLDDVLA
jgi:hypothetical protein